MKILTAILLTLICTIFLAQKSPSHALWNSLLQKHVSADGQVDYKGMIQDSAKLNEYCNLLSANKPRAIGWTKNEDKAYWINAYNAFTVKLIVKNYPVKSIKDLGGSVPFVNTAWDIKFIRIGGKKFDLNKIEHKKLRRKYRDARVHFALVCASSSCPILLNKAFLPETLDAQLDEQAKVFLKDKFRNDISATNPKLSKIFDWYGMDFKSKGVSVIDFINRYSEIQINKNAKVEYLDYIWELNDKK